MSLEPTRLMRSSGAAIIRLAFTALRRDAPVQERLATVTVMTAIIHQMLVRWGRRFQRDLHHVLEWMKQQGFEVEEPRHGERLFEWFLRVTQKMDGEDVLHYIDRVARLCIRLAAVLMPVSMSDELLELGEGLTEE